MAKKWWSIVETKTKIVMIEGENEAGALMNYTDSFIPDERATLFEDYGCKAIELPIEDDVIQLWRL